MLATWFACVFFLPPPQRCPLFVPRVCRHGSSSRCVEAGHPAAGAADLGLFTDHGTSSTDPVGVLAIVRIVRVPKAECVVAGRNLAPAGTVEHFMRLAHRLGEIVPHQVRREGL